MTTARLSIIIPTYNYANTLERAVLSVCKQMDEETEVIIVNDGSTDNTADVLLSLQQKLNGKIKVFDKMNGGAASARNLGIVNSTGDYFIFLDADDEMAENGINQIREHLKQHNSSKFIIGGHTSVFPSGKRKLHKPSALPAQPIAKLKAYLIDKTLSLSNGACLMHKSIFNELVYPECFRNSEDIPIFAHAIANFECSIINAPLANIYKHDDSLRHNVAHTENAGLQLVEAVFSPDRISAELQVLKKPFFVQRLLSLSRVSHEAGMHQNAAIYYQQALRVNWQVLFKWSYTKKYLKSKLTLLYFTSINHKI